MLRPVLALLALVAAQPAAAEIYNWKDKDGNIHYSDIPPPRGDVKTLRSRVAPSAVPPAAPTGDKPAETASSAPTDASNRPKSLAERELEFRQRRAAEAEAQTKADQEAADKAEKDRACEQARNQLTALTSGQRVSRFNASGERVVIDDAERAAEISRTQQQIDKACN